MRTLALGIGVVLVLDRLNPGLRLVVALDLHMHLCSRSYVWRLRLIASSIWGLPVRSSHGITVHSVCATVGRLIPTVCKY